jgi:hypothetical protein
MEVGVTEAMTNLLLIPIFVAIFGMSVYSFFHVPIAASAFSAHTYACSDNAGYDCTNPNQPPGAKGCPDDDTYT